MKCRIVISGEQGCKEIEQSLPIYRLDILDLRSNEHAVCNVGVHYLDEEQSNDCLKVI